MQDILDHPEFDWYYGYLSKNPNITFKYILDNIDKDWDFCYLANNLFSYDIELLLFGLLFLS